MSWIANHKYKIKEKSMKNSQSSSKVVGLGPADLWEFLTLHGASASVAMVLIWFSRNIPVLAADEFT